MAAGDSFATLLDSDQTPPPKVEPLSSEPGELEQAAKLKAQQKGTTVVGGPFASQALRDAQVAEYQKGEDVRLEARRQKEAAGLHAADAAQKASDVLTAHYGTDDPRKAALVKATGAFDDDFAQRMQMDPEGGKASFERAKAILGRTDAADAAKVGLPPRTYSEGVGLHGERYFTNLSEGELYAEHAPVRGVQPGPTPSGALKPLYGMREDTAPGDESAGKSPAEILFQGKFDKAEMIAGKPERDAKYMAKLSDKRDELLALGKTEGADVARQKNIDLLKSGFYQHPKDAQLVESSLLKHAYSPTQMAAKRLTDPEAMPWTKQGLPGKAADKAEPASVLNPGGAQPLDERTDQMHMNAVADHAQALEESTPSESKTTRDFALSPTAERLKGVADKQREQRRQERIKEFGFDYSPPTIGGFLKTLVGRGE